MRENSIWIPSQSRFRSWRKTFESGSGLKIICHRLMKALPLEKLYSIRMMPWTQFIGWRMMENTRQNCYFSITAYAWILCKYCKYKSITIVRFYLAFDLTEARNFILWQYYNSGNFLEKKKIPTQNKINSQFKWFSITTEQRTIYLSICQSVIHRDKYFDR